ncbi:MAG: (2Fe-2S)-binding protein, partial [Caldilineaceae bacterium]|nr:(2Fe-2S)-binding protein [Caldilineaceae bacterium]
MNLRINGTEKEIDGGPGALLVYVLRDELGMTGTKIGCAAGICGSCTVLVDGVATRSCITPLTLVEGKEITTIEGLATENADGTLTLHPVQQAFIDAQVPQCGWCMSGQIMTAAAFLQQNPAPSEDDVIEAMGENYCRCGCYHRI